MPRQQQVCCSNCGTSTVEFNINQHNGYHVCLLCTDILLFKSVLDERYYPRTMRVPHPDIPGFITREQLNQLENYINCYTCGCSIHRDESRTAMEDDGGLVDICDYCYDYDSTPCQRRGCSNVSLNSHSFTVQNADHEELQYCYICDDEHSTSCNNCDTQITTHIDHYHEESECYYCTNCTPATPEVVVHNYYYNVPTNFNKVREENTVAGKYYKRDYPYYGIELEVDTPNDYFRNVAAKCLLLADETKTYCKEDSSTDGFEIVTQPMTFEYQKQFGWRNILKEIHKSGGRGYDSGNCGIHVHVTRNSYSPLTWWKVIEFTWKCKAFVKSFAQRNGNYSYCRYKPANEYDNYESRKTIYPQNHDTRYLAINFGDRQPTAEFRMFRATTSYERFWATIQFVNAVVEFCNQNGYPSIVRYDTEHVWNEFVLFVREKTTHHNLIKHLIRRNLTNNALCA